MDVTVALFKLFAVLIGAMFVIYALAAVIAAITLGTLETLRQGWELESSLKGNKKLARASNKRTRR